MNNNNNNNKVPKANATKDLFWTGGEKVKKEGGKRSSVFVFSVPTAS